MIAPAPSAPLPRRFPDHGSLVMAGGLAVITAMIAAFAALLDGVADTEGLATVDLPIVQALATTRAPALVFLMRIVTTLGSPVVMLVIAAVVCGVLARCRRRIEPVVLGTVGVGGIGGIDTAAKHIVARPRPPAALHAVTAHGYSFPSGHAIISTLVIVLCAAMITRWFVRRPGLQILLWTGAVTAIALVGFSRVYLGVHYPSDILAGWTLAMAWATTIGLATLGIHARRGSSCPAPTGADK